MDLDAIWRVHLWGPVTHCARRRDVVSVLTSRLGLVLDKRIDVSVSSRVSGHFVSSRRFVHALAVHSFSSPVLTSTPCVSELFCQHQLVAMALANSGYFVTSIVTSRLVPNANEKKQLFSHLIVDLCHI